MGVWNFGAHDKGAYVTSPQFKKKNKTWVLSLQCSSLALFIYGHGHLVAGEIKHTL